MSFIEILYVNLTKSSRIIFLKIGALFNCFQMANLFSSFLIKLERKISFCLHFQTIKTALRKKMNSDIECYPSKYSCTLQT